MNDFVKCPYCAANEELCKSCQINKGTIDGLKQKVWELEGERLRLIEIVERLAKVAWRLLKE